MRLQSSIRRKEAVSYQLSAQKQQQNQSQQLTHTLIEGFRQIPSGLRDLALLPS